jgi:hypothetical protein
MTATRWWVRLFARWQARIDSVKGQIQAVSLSVTALSTFSLVLKGTVLQPYIPVLWGIALVLGPLYAYLYAEGGVWNQTARDRQDMSNNFAGPNARIQAAMMARALAAMQQGEQLSDEQREAGQEELQQAFEELRDGVELDD